ncbi:MAG: hypothetical protein HQK54_15835 [Oligoflexales bacterium]|nr:hypothetical protein [Oligoflexales bacterium]
MKIVCSYCRIELDREKPADDANKTFGLCNECLQMLRIQIKDAKIRRYLDGVERPAFVVNKDSRLVDHNEKMKLFLKLDGAKIDGFLGGEILNCKNAQRKERCGNTPNCKKCVVKSMVNKVFQTGEEIRNLPVKIEQKDSIIQLKISFFKLDNYVIVVVEDVIRVS